MQYVRDYARRPEHQDKRFVISMSFGSLNWSGYLGFKAQLDSAFSEDILSFAAACNHHQTVHWYPAAWESVVAVGATDRADSLACYSNYGKLDDFWVDIAAPGGEFQKPDQGPHSCGDMGGGTGVGFDPWLPAGAGGTRYYGWTRGTSDACPFAAGIAGLILSRNNTLTAPQVRNIIEQSATKVHALEGGEYAYDATGKCQAVGFGRVNAYGAMQLTPPMQGGNPGCPYLFCWADSGYVVDNNLLPLSEYLPDDPPYSTDYYKLMQPLVPNEDGYELEIREFEQEHDFFDRVNLMRVDHGPSIGVAVASEGRIAKYRATIPPRSAIDQNGNDRLQEIEARGGGKFEGHEGDALVLTFGPSGGRPFRAQFPDGFPIDLLLVVDQKPPTCEDPVCIVVQVPDPDSAGQWKDVTFINPRAYWEDAMVDLSDEISEIQDSVQVRLLWTAEHDLDFAAFLIPSLAPVDTASLSLLQATHSEHGSMLQELGQKDSVYAEIVPGEQIGLLFGVDRPVPPAMSRDFIFTSSGYYVTADSLLEARQRPAWSDGEPEAATIESGPNPLRAGSGTRIAFSLPHAQRTSLNIYDVSGRRVRVLENGVRLAGRHLIWWDGRDEQGRGVAPGMYFSVLQSETGRETKKLVVIR